MKRLLLILMALALLLTACGKEAEKTAPPSKGAAEQTEREEVRVIGLYQISCEWEEYDPSAESISFWVENHSEADIQIGVDYGLEVQDENGAWQQVPMVENAAWIAVALNVPAGERVALNCALSLFDYDFSRGGTYRIVKVLEGETCTGEFTMRAGAAVSETNPYGFEPLEMLPEYFSAADTGSGEVIFTAEGVENLSAAELFLDKVGSGVACQLRTVQDYGEGTPMVIDVIYENDHFLWRMWSQGDVVEQRFSYIVTDGLELYLSNGVDWARTEAYGSQTVLLIPQGATGAMLTAVEEQAAGQLLANVARYRIWSEDGTCSAALTEDPTEISVSWQKSGEGSRGELFRLQTAVTDLNWQPDGTLRFVGDDGQYRGAFDPVSWTLRDGKE